MGSRDRRHGRLGVALLAAAAIHALLLAAVVASHPALRMPEVALAPDVQLIIEHRPAPPSALGRMARRRTAEAPYRLAATASAAAAAARRAPTPMLEARPLPEAASVTAPASPAPPPSPGGIDDAWRVRPQAGPLRTLGAAPADCGRRAASLTRAEQAACDRAAAQARVADTPAVDLIPAAKRGYYDAVVAKREHDRTAAFKDMAAMQGARGMAGVRTNIDMTVGYRCSFKLGVGAGAANRAAGKTIGFPPCPIRAPGAEPPPP